MDLSTDPSNGTLNQGVWKVVVRILSVVRCLSLRDAV